MQNTDRIVAIAQSWIGTPYVHQASAKGAGTDCLGVIRGIWRELCGAEPADIPAYSADWSEPSGEERLWEAARDYLVTLPLGPLDPGNVLLFRMRSGGVAKHLGVVVSGDPAARFVHAYSGHGVTASYLSEPWRRRIAARFAFPETLIGRL